MTEQEYLKQHPDAVLPIQLAYSVGTLAVKGFHNGQAVLATHLGYVELLNPTSVGQRPKASNKTQCV